MIFYASLCASLVSPCVWSDGGTAAKDLTLKVDNVYTEETEILGQLSAISIFRFFSDMYSDFF